MAQNNYSDANVIRFYDTIKDHFDEFGLKLVVTYSEFRLIRESIVVFQCNTVSELHAFHRGLTFVKNA